MNETALAPYLLAGLGILLLLAIGFAVYRAVSMQASWTSSVRGLLERGESWTAAANRRTKGLSTRAFYGLQALAAIAVILFIIGWARWTVVR